MRRVIITVVSLIVIGSITIVSITAFNRNTYRTNFLQRYYDTLNAMFDNGWELIAAQNHVISEDGLIRYNPPLRLTSWLIEYVNSNGDIQEFRFNNSRDFHQQIELHVIPLLQNYFINNFFTDIDICHDTLILNTQLNLLQGNHFSDSHRHWFPIVHDYRTRFATPDGAIRLSQLTPANAFEMLPLYFCVIIHVRSEDGQRLPNDVEMEKIHDILERLNDFTNYAMTASIVINQSRSWFYIRGEYVSDLEGMRPGLTDRTIFETHVFESNLGVFW